MTRREAKHLKALYFDLNVKRLKEYYSDTNPNGAYGKIRDYLIKRNFSHVQYSGYHSKYKTTDLEIFDLIHEMSEDLKWLAPCLNHFENPFLNQIVYNNGTLHMQSTIFIL